jgi:hypothetical protein
MGLKCPPDYAQEVMENVFWDVEDTDVYIDVSDSASDNRNESSHSLLIDDRDIADCLMNLPCFPSRKKKEGRPINAESVPKQCCLTSMIPL